MPSTTIPILQTLFFLKAGNRTGVEHFYEIFFAIRNRRIVTFEHYNYKNKLMTSRKVHPLALKESKDPLVFDCD